MPEPARIFRPRNLSADGQWRLLQTLSPAIPALYRLQVALVAPSADVGDAQTLIAALASLTDQQTVAVFEACRTAVEEKVGDGWQDAAGDVGLDDLIAMSMQVVSANFGPLLALERPSYSPVPSDLPDYAAASLPNGDDWLWRPVLRSVFKGESLFDGTIRIEHIARANDALDVEAENQARAHRAAEKARPRA